MKRIIIIILSTYNFTFLFSYCANLGVNVSNLDVPEGNWIVLANGSWNNWSWGTQLTNNDSLFIGDVCDLSPGEYQYIYAITGDFDNWSGWGIVGNAPAGSYCDYNPNDQWQNYGFSISDSDIITEHNNWGECGTNDYLENELLISPQNGDFLNYIHVPFRWKQMPDAIGYNIQISQSEYFENNTINLYSNLNAIFQKNNINWNSTYYWRIRPVFNNQNFGEWSSVNIFFTGEMEFNLTSEIFSENDLEYNYTVFSDWNNMRTVIVDLEGREIWNSGNYAFMLNNISQYGQLFGSSYLNYPNNTGIEINYDEEVIWNAPNAIDPHAFKQIYNGNYMGFVGSSSEWGPIPIGPWTETYQNMGYFADGITPEIIYKTQILTEFHKETKEVIWSWNPVDYFSIEHSDLYGGVWWNSWMDGFHDWTHSNAFFYDKIENAIYISSRHLSRITKINYQTKEIIWNMGLYPEYGTGEENICSDLEFSYQHHIQRLDDGSLLFFDNGNLDVNIFNHNYNTSRAIRIAVVNNSFCVILWEYELPPEFFGAGMGSVQLLENGNYFINTTGNSGTLLEVSPDNEILWKLTLGLLWPNGSGYRAFRLKDIHPGLFSIVADNFTTINYNDSIVTAIKISDESDVLKFNVSNLSDSKQPYIYKLNNLYGDFFESSEDTIIIDPFSDYEITFYPISLVNSIGQINLNIHPQFHPYLEQSLSITIINNLMGDINSDGVINILDVVGLVNIILGISPENSAGDLNQDGVYNVLDIVQLVNIILGN